MKKCVRLFMIKQFIIVLVIVIFVSAPIFGYEVIERFRLGAVVEGLTYINSGPLEGKIALVDGSSVYLHDPALGNYDKIFSVLGTGFVMPPRGIAYLSQGPFAGDFLLVDWGSTNLPSTLYLFTETGGFVGPVVAQDFAWWGAEGLTQITSGRYKGLVALITGQVDKSWHITIFQLGTYGGEFGAWIVKDIVFDIPAPSSGWVAGIAYLPEDFPDPNYRDMFVVSHTDPGSIHVVDLEGKCVAAYPGIAVSEGLTYFSSGAYRGSFFLSHTWLFDAEIRNLDGSFSVPSSLPRVGLGLGFISRFSFTWQKDREQFFLLAWDGTDYDIPAYFVSRQSTDFWRLDEQRRIPYFRYANNLTEKTADGTYKLFGVISEANEPRRYGVASLNADFEQIGEIIPFPDEYAETSFGSLVYVAGDTPAADRFIAPSGKKIFSFDPEFKSEEIEMIADLSDVLTTNINSVCYDSAARRFYLLHRQNSDIQDWICILRVFNADWKIIGSFSIDNRPNCIAKISSGELRGNLALYQSGNTEVIILNVEYDLAADLIGRLIGDIQTTGLKKGLAKSLMSKLEDALDSIEKKHARPAVNQLEEFIDAVRAQSGKDIPAATAEGWMALAQNVINGLRELL